MPQTSKERLINSERSSSINYVLACLYQEFKSGIINCFRKTFNKKRFTQHFPNIALFKQKSMTVWQTLETVCSGKKSWISFSRYNQQL